jgi:antitoxin component YwqK of YwqJK toxin-antitoxin module
MIYIYIILSITFFNISFCCGPEEVMKEKGEYLDGQKHGKWISYCEHGNIIEEGNYKDGKKHGKWISYLEDGSIWYEENFIDGKEYGEFILYGYGNYNIFHKLKLENKKDGNLDGKSMHYHINGEIGRVQNYKDGIKNGTDIFYDKNGRIYWSGNYKDGILIDGQSIKSDEPFDLY